MKITYREFQKADTSALVSLSNDEWRVSVRSLEPMLAKYDGVAMKCYVAESGDSIIGLAAGFILPNATLNPELVYVLPEFRNNGIGTKLLKQLENHCGCQASIIYYNKDMHDYYAKRGYFSTNNLEVAIKNI